MKSYTHDTQPYKNDTLPDHIIVFACLNFKFGNGLLDKLRMHKEK